MELIAEILLEFLLEGSLELAKSKNVPLWARLLARAVLLGIYGGLVILFAMLLYNGIRESNLPLTMIAGAVILLMLALAVVLVRSWLKRRHIKKSDQTPKADS